MRWVRALKCPAGPQTCWQADSCPEASLSTEPQFEPRAAVLSQCLSSGWSTSQLLLNLSAWEIINQLSSQMVLNLGLSDVTV